MQTPMQALSPDAQTITASPKQINPFLSSGLFAVPAFLGTTTLKRSLVLCFAMDLMMLAADFAAQWVPKKLPAALRILSYSLLAALVYLPAGLAADFFFPDISIGAVLPMLSMGVLMTLLTAEKIPARRWVRTGRTCLALLGWNAVLLLMGTLRELLAEGTLWAFPLIEIGVMPSAAKTWFGMLLLGILAAGIRAFRMRERKEESSNANL